MKDLLRTTADRAARYLASLKERSVAPTPEALANLARLDEPLPERPAHPAAVIALLDEVGSPATMGSAGGRFFGFVVGGSLPAAVAASSLAAAWDQNAGIVALSPIAARRMPCWRGVAGMSRPEGYSARRRSASWWAKKYT